MIDRLDGVPFDLNTLHGIDKKGLFAALYGNYRILQEHIDEEGCGAVIAAARIEEFTND